MLAIGGAIAIASAGGAGDGNGRAPSANEDSVAVSRRHANRAARAGQPRGLTGVPLQRPTGLRLVVASPRPFVLDVDSGSSTHVRGVPARRAGVVSVVTVGGRGAAIATGWGADARVYGLRSHNAGAVDLGSGRGVAPATSGDAVWIQAVGEGRRCTIRRVSLTGQTTVRRRAFRCAATIAPGGRAGIVVNRTLLYDPATGQVVLRAPAGVVAAAGTTLVLATSPGKSFTLLDSQTRRQKLLRWPSRLGAADAPAIDPRGRFVALAFADPGKQVLDVWLLDTRTRGLTHLPSMPASVALKRTSMAWTNDGRLVVLGHSLGRDLVAVWRPGQRRLAIKTVRLGLRTGGSDSFAPIR